MTSAMRRKTMILAAALCLAPPVALAQKPVASIEVQVKRCWTSPSAEPATSVRPITFTLHLEPDGHLREASTDYVPANAVERTLRDAAVRAMKRCLPLDPPNEPYDDWKATQVTFQMDKATRTPQFDLPD
ncbi:hypothetical protein VQ042_21160 [Aurantimonas sp. A2-1-M11]|uniref:hypothetical protein n=1 Tax=Aurantimonas sp. A2-1-M11 TaxID=3113712 RepID=UPI002F9395A2